VTAGSICFALAFALGCQLGPVREVVLAPRFGATAAAAMEAVPMLAGMALGAPWAARLRMGAMALALLVLAKSARDWLPRGELLWLARTRTPEGRIGLGLLVAFAAMPLLLRRRG